MISTATTNPPSILHSDTEKSKMPKNITDYNLCFSQRTLGVQPVNKGISRTEIVCCIDMFALLLSIRANQRKGKKVTDMTLKLCKLSAKNIILLWRSKLENTFHLVSFYHPNKSWWLYCLQVFFFFWIKDHPSSVRSTKVKLQDRVKLQVSVLSLSPESCSV